MKHVLSVQAFEHYLICDLDDGQSYKYDMNFVFKKTGEMIEPLKEMSFFKKVFIDSGALAWPNGYEIHANTVHRDGTVFLKKVS
jgi:hypothetical protein